MSGPVGGINHNRIPQPSGQPQADDLLPYMDLAIHVILACAADIARPARRQKALEDLHAGGLGRSFAALSPDAERRCRRALDLAIDDPAAYRAWHRAVGDQRCANGHMGKKYPRRPS